MEVAELLWFDDEYPHELALDDCLGDRFLISQNAMYRRLRELARALGATFVSALSSDQSDYAIASLLCLPQILESGVVPYKPNVSTLRRIALRSPRLNIQPELLLTIVSQNYVLHESAHFISWKFFQEGSYLKSLYGDQRDLVLLYIACEAYANAIERVAGANHADELHRIFFAFNSYTDLALRPFVVVRELIESFGSAMALVTATWSYFFLNLHEGLMPEYARGYVSDLATAGRQGPERWGSLVRLSVEMGFTLSRQFIRNTTPLFFRYLGMEEAYRSVIADPPGPDLLSQIGVHAAFVQIASFTMAKADPESNIDTRSQQVANV